MKKQKCKIAETACCGSQADHDSEASISGSSQNSSIKSKDWIIDTIRCGAGDVPVVKTTLLISDRIGSWKARWTFGRMQYTVPPGLYAVGKPTAKSPVFVSANYKMSFDRLRSALNGNHAWIVVLDTKGINVWCAAGKGTFGTEEIVNRIKDVRLDKVVSHHKLILPQLGAPGVAAHEVKASSGFRVIYGPIRASDIPAFLESESRATPEMQRIRFPLWDRIVLVPADLMLHFKYAIIAAICFLLLSGFGPGVYSLDRILSVGISSASLVLTLYVALSVLVPVLLPWLPGRAFSVKGAWLGSCLAILAGWLVLGHSQVPLSNIMVTGWVLIIVASSSFIAMNFTGTSTYTSLSGVLKEMRIAVPLQLVGATVGLVLWITGLFI
ncbi:MAG: acetyl-CoA synthase subunit gamma [candidate division Zixibacteria bacterium]|nr:acetyl-CoA synthase subunit gamma [candidate division Zixibacteria bacterium]